MNVTKLKFAMRIAHWGVPMLVTLFVVTYWILGMANYWNPDVSTGEAEKEPEEGSSSLCLVLGAAGAVLTMVLLLACCLLPKCWSRCSTTAVQAITKIGQH